MSQPQTMVSLLVAKVTSLAEDTVQEDNTTTFEREVIARIKKCLDRANHPTTPEAEAKAALRMSSRLMEQYNVRQADLLAAEVDSEGPSTLCGQSTVNVFNQKPDGRVVIESWVQNISRAIQTFFDCKVYKIRRSSSIDWTFYGIATNTVAGAMAFEMVHNLVQDWSGRRRGNKNSYRLGVAGGLRNIAHREKKDEERRVREQEAQELVTREAVEKRKRQEEIDRLSGNVFVAQVADTSSSTPPEDSLRVKIEEEDEVTIKSEPVETSSGLPKMPSEVMKEAYGTDDDNIDDDLMCTNDSESDCGETDPETDYGETDAESDTENTSELPGTTFDEENELAIDPSANFDDELRRHMPKQESPAPQNADATPSPYPEDQNSKDKQSGMLWRNASALVHFRENAQKAADNYLETQKVKLRTDRQRTNHIRDWSAYRAGQDDSKKIDVKRRRIEG